MPLLARTHATLLRTLGSLAARRHPRPAHLQVGEQGELEAFLYLRSLGLTVVARQWTTGRLRGDLDLVAWEADTLCFVEVKTRAHQNLLDPAEAAVDRRKREILRRMASAYLRGFPPDLRRSVPTRFDTVSVYLHPAAGQGTVACELLRNSFSWREPQNA